jgi:serine-type D-Ala-D-Ala carboxypeptidase (penicillin-binding protein 5/6)
MKTSPVSAARIAAVAMLALSTAFVSSADAQQRRTKQAPAQAQQQQQQPAPAADASSQTLQTTAKQAIVIDYQTGAVLFEKNADERMAPSSMSKIMTTYMVFKEIKEGHLSLDDEFTVSEKAWRIQGSKMFVPLGGKVKVGDLVKGVIIQSGNDACVVLAEGIAGSEQAFAERMNDEAKRLGLTNSNFRNASGWPDPEHYMTARDLATLAMHLIKDDPEHYKYYSEKDYTYGTDEKGTPIKQGNRNPLLYKNTGADGIKTGHTEVGGYGLTASAVRDGRRIIMVLNGMPSMKNRAEEGERVLDWAYREFGTYQVAKAGQVMDKADVWLGEQESVQLVAAQDVFVTIPRRARQQMKVTTSFEAPVPAPVKKGTEVGKLVVTVPGMDPVEAPLVAESDVNKLGFTGRIAASLSHLIWGNGKK